jgi:hypothetical protein
LVNSAVSMGSAISMGLNHSADSAISVVSAISEAVKPGMAYLLRKRGS